MANRTAVAVLLLALATATGVAAQSTSDTEGKQIQASLQVSGTVVSSDANRLIVKGDNGQQMTFIVNESTADPKLFHVGDRVTASYVTLAGTGPVVTKVISIPAEERTTSTGTVIYPPAAPTASATATVTTPAPAPAAEAEVATTTTTTTETAAIDTDDTDEEMATTLPATASPLPLIALAGFAAGGAARLIRRFRK
jgi:hypothetical protein